MGHFLVRGLLGRGPCSLCLNQVFRDFLGFCNPLAVYTRGKAPELIKLVFKPWLCHFLAM